MKKLITICAIFFIVACSAQADLMNNGDFETGDLTGWMVFTTSNGTVGAGLPDVVLFDTNNDTTATKSARFNVGEVFDFPFGRHGGGIYQDVNVTIPDSYHLQADAAVLSVADNLDGGLFELLFNGVVVDSHDFGSVEKDVAEYALLAADLVGVTTGTYDIRIRMSRNLLGSGPVNQYIDNVSLVPVPGAPVPGAVILGILGLGVAGLKLRKYA